MEEYKVPQPKKVKSTKRESELLRLFLENNETINNIWLNTSDPYMPWEKFRVRHQQGQFKLVEKGQPISADEAWFLLAFRRQFASQTSPIIDKSGKKFTWSKLPTHEKQLHEFDMKIGGNMMSERMAAGKVKKERFLRQSLVEEAIASSQLEGAATTRDRAKKMLVENKQPKNHDEWMIYNNYQTIRKISQEVSNYDLSREVLLDLHVLMTRNAIEADQMGRWRKDDDEIVVKRQIGAEEYIVHVPPSEDVLQQELDKLIDFANDKDGSKNEFIHPIVKAIILHFWFAYLHPFCDGNGRLARSLFYWYLIKHDYWLIEYLPISMVIKKSPAQYADSYIYSEQYQSDLNYFIDYNFRKLQQALAMFDRHVEEIREKSHLIDRFVPEKGLNERQKQVLHHLLGKPEDELTITQHANFHEVGWLTASRDIKDLMMRGYLSNEKRGKEVYYTASDKLVKMLGDG